MRTRGMVVVATLLATPALAGDCDTWKAGIEQDEGGPTMIASICAANRPDDVLLVSCWSEKELGLRFLPMTGDDFPPGGDMNYESTFIFASGLLSAEVSLHYEAMDGALTATPRHDSELVRILESKGPLTVTDKTGVLPAATFILAGSSAAIGKVERACHD